MGESLKAGWSKLNLKLAVTIVLTTILGFMVASIEADNFVKAELYLKFLWAIVPLWLILMTIYEILPLLDPKFAKLSTKQKKKIEPIPKIGEESGQPR